MAKFEDLIKRREQLIADAEAQATTRLRGIEVDAWNFVADVILGLDTKVGKLEFSARNIQKIHNGTEKAGNKKAPFGAKEVMQTSLVFLFRFAQPYP